MKTLSAGGKISHAYLGISMLSLTTEGEGREDEFGCSEDGCSDDGYAEDWGGEDEYGEDEYGEDGEGTTESTW